MILKALYDYYHRSGDLPPMGFEKKELYFIIVIDENGKFIPPIIDTRNNEGKPKEFIVPRGETRASGIKANLLWDNVEYVLAVPKEDNDSAKKKAQEKNKAFIERCKSLAEEMPDIKDFKAICAFYENGISHVETASNWDDVLNERTRNISFQLKHSLEIVPCIHAVKEYLNNSNNNDISEENLKYCLVTGKKGKTVRLTTSTSIPGSQATARLVAFQKSSGYDSYGKEQCTNAPISEEAEAAYVTALKKLTAKDSRNKFYLGNRTFLFWASKNDAACSEVENSFFDFLGNANLDDPNKNIARVKEVMKSIWSGMKQSSSDDRFYMLGLAPNAARIAVVYWNECSLKEFAGRILRHFEDMEIVDTRKEGKPYMGIYSMLSAVTLGGKQSEVQPNLPEAVLKSIVQGIAYPFTLYSSCLRRITAELGEMTCFSITRMAIIKAYLNRLKNSNDKKIEIMLDKENTNAGYLCGRLFAVLDKIQEDANGIHSMRERYMNAASTTPATVFGTLMNLSSHHAEKLNEGAKINYEKMKQEIIGKLPSDGFRPHLDLQDQGRFFVGYYQQRADFFTKKNDDNKQE